MITGQFEHTIVSVSETVNFYDLYIARVIVINGVGQTGGNIFGISQAAGS